MKTEKPSSEAADQPGIPKLMALVHDPRTDVHHRLVRFRGQGGARRTQLLRNQTFAEGTNAVLRSLSDADYAVPAGTAARNRLIEGIQAQQSARTLILVDQIGWAITPAGTVFVFPDKMIGKAHRGIHVSLRNGYPAEKFTCSGTSKGWKEQVAALAAGNPALLFVLALAFAPPLLRLLGEECGGFQLVAPTRTGKSTASEAAASVWGNKFGDNWRTTPNAIERTASDYNDLLLVLDDPALLAANQTGRADVLYEAAHQLASGRGKERLTSPGRPVEWLNLFLSASEETFRRIIAKGKRSVVGGELVRLVDIELSPTDSQGLYPNLHGHSTTRSFCTELKAAMGRHHGKPGRAYIRQLVQAIEQDRDGLTEWLKARTAYYRDRAAEGVGQSPAAESISARFALVYAAGCLAARYRVLPYARDDIYAAVRYCHRHAHVEPEDESSGSKPSARTSAKRQKQLAFTAAKRISSLRRRLVNLRKEPSPDVEGALGFIHKGKGGLELLFRRESFSDVVCRGDSYEPVVKALRAQGLVVTHEGGKMTVARKLPAPLGRMRMIAIRDAKLRRLLGEHG